jgi:glycosyltransferase involved in cell wall biosynthesis
VIPLHQQNSGTIALFLPALYDGGAERVMLNLSCDFANKGWQVDLVLAKAVGNYLNQVPQNVRIVDLGASRTLFALPKLVRYLKKVRPSSMLTAMHYANIVAAMSAIVAQVDTHVVLSEHTVLRPEMFQSRSSKILLWLMRRFYPLYDIIAVSQGVADSLQKVVRVPRSKIRVVYNPILSDRLVKFASQPLDHPWFQDEQPPVILAAGRLVDAKDYPTLLRAFAKIREQRHARLIILGEGPRRPDLEKLICRLKLNEDILMPGFVDNPFQYMKRASLFVLSSQYEGFGNVLVEALACGIPVVSTRCSGGPTEILADGRFGELVSVGNVEEMAAAILRTLDQEHDPDLLVSRARDFSVGTIGNQYLEVLYGNGTEKSTLNF